MSESPHTHLWISCRRATELASRAMEVSLSRRERFALDLHTLVCGWCRRYRAQITRLRLLMKRREENLPGLSAEARDRLARSLAAASEK